VDQSVWFTVERAVVWQIRVYGSQLNEL